MFIEVEYNTNGEICVRGPNIMKGCLNNKEATDAVFDQDGYYHTGDIAFVDENGNCNCNCNCNCKIGIYSEEDETEYPVAYVVTQKNVQQTDEMSEEIVNFVDGQVAHHKKLRGGVIYIDKIPKNALGKILRRELRDRHSTATRLMTS